jgi:plastocyanin
MLRFGFVAMLLGFFAVATTSQATTHIVKFGHSLLYTYSPDTMSIRVGDTIQWEGDFTFHPLQSFQVPLGADSFYYDGVDTMYRYAIKVEGEYNYRCTQHDSSQGMYGAFSARPQAASITWIITFGAAHVYTPNDLPDVRIGDTIEWQGSFAGHPLTIDEFPATAETFNPVTSGTSFRYPIKVAGLYTYYCSFHGGKGGVGMAGKFGLGPAGVNDHKNSFLELLAPFPTPTKDKAVLSFSLDQAATVTLRILSLDGKELKAFHDFYSEGEHSINYDASSLAAGEYLVVLEANGIRQTQRMVVTK